MPHNNEATFSVYHFLHNDKDAYAMIDTKFRNFVDKKKYPWFLSLSVTLEDSAIDGYVTEQEAEKLNAFEDNIEHEIKKITKVCFVGRVTCDKHRELIYYAQDNKEKIVNFLEEATSNVVYTKFGFMIEKDELWDNVQVYLNF